VNATPETCAADCLRFLEEQLFVHLVSPDDVAAIVVEPIQGEGGFVVPADGFLPGLAAFAAKHGIVFVADEIQSGMGRAGRWYAIEDEGVVPDLVLSAKSLGGGLPISAVTGRTEIMDSVHVGGLGGTYGGNPVAAAAALAVLDTIERDGLLERSRTLGERIGARLEAMRGRFEVVGDVRGRGAMRAIELVSDRATKEPLEGATMAAIGRAALERGVIVLTAGTYGNVLRLLPPITIEDGVLGEGLDLLEESVALVAG
jgi:4-aminobutyrate aminotransferase/(S)-3-amino-2-methylpropionate transaminase